MNIRSCLLTVVICVLGSSTYAQEFRARTSPQQQVPQRSGAERITNPELREELLRRIEMDQLARQHVVRSVQESTDGRPEDRFLQRRAQVDQSNQEWLDSHLRTNKWPGRSEVGEDGAHAAWMIVQHSDDDLQFQVRCLNLMRNAPNGEVALVDVAFLTDEVLVARGDKQLYGTQVRMRNGEFRVAAVKEPESLNRRRAELGLESIERYLDSIRQNFQARNSGTTRSR